MGTSFASVVLAIGGEETAARIFANRRSSKACFTAERAVAFPGGFWEEGLDEVMLSMGYADLSGQREERDFC